MIFILCQSGNGAMAIAPYNFFPNIKTGKNLNPHNINSTSHNVTDRWKKNMMSSPPMTMEKEVRTRAKTTSCVP